MGDYRFYLDRLLAKKKSAVNPLLEYLVAGWKLDEDANDIKGIHNGTSVGVNYVFDVVRNKVVADFAGEDYVDTGYNDYEGVSLFAGANEEWNLSFWISPNLNTSGTRVMLSKASTTTTTRNILFFSSNNKIYIQIRRTTGIMLYPIDNTDWVHFSFNYKEDVANCYINGIPYANNPIPIGPNDKNNFSIILGGYSESTSSRYIGKMSDVYIFNKPLSEEEIQLAMQGL